MSPVLFAGQLPSEKEIAGMLIQQAGPHPRLFLHGGEEESLKQRIKTTPVMGSLRDCVIASAEKMLSEPPLTRVLEGKRLLGVSRACLQRVVTLSMGWRLTGDRRYLERARQELLAVAAFSDWHPEHFLDVAEMTAGVAIGYDWLYQSLDPPTRLILSKAIIEKGINPSFQEKFSRWAAARNNWNQVCNGGLVLGALSVADEQPELAARVITRALASVPLATAAYAPDGAYPEGPGYWSYGTTYSVLMIEALKSVLGTDFNLTKQPGFLSSGDFMLHATGSSGQCFDYSDSKPNLGIEPSLFWIASQRHDPAILWFMDKMLAGSRKPSDAEGERLSLILLWMDPMLRAVQPTVLDWKADGPNPVAFLRSGWGHDDLFVGIKGGSPSVNHAHMDIGSFVFDALGVRWAHALGMQDYNSLESRGIDLFNGKQDSQRWQVFRISNHSKNMIVINEGLQSVKGKAEIITRGFGTQEPVADLDCSTVFDGQARKVERVCSLPGRKSLRIDDTVDSVSKDGIVRWQMMTDAMIRISGSTAELTKNGRSLAVRCLQPEGSVWKEVDVSAPKHEYDAPNPGMKQLVLEVPVHPGDSPRITVMLEPHR